VTTLDQTTHDQTTRAELVNRAKALQPLLREHVKEGEVLRRLPDAVVEALTEAGFYRLLVPRRFGGYEAEVRTIVEITETLAEADASAAWTIGVTTTGAWCAGQLPDRGQREIFGTDSDTRIAGSATPVEAQWVNGGLRVSGRWGYATGSTHASWLSITAALPAADGRPEAMMMCFVPKDQLRIEDTWRTIGMRGTGSNTLVADDLFVPEHRMVPAATLADGAWPAASDSPMYRLTFGPMAELLLVGPLLGMGNAALNYTIDKASTKAMHHTVFARQVDSVGVQLQIADAALKLRTARLHAYDAADEVDRTAAEGDSRNYSMRARIRAQCGYAAQQVLDAINTLVNVHGAGSFAHTNPLQQIWRDANTGGRHAGVHAQVGYEVYGKSLLSVEERISPLV
jgi:3-hydroxy-9,10-secoandrosta-1,3,5(10)-triene-9,17-dione monooxygenase